MWASTDGFQLCASRVLCCSTSRIHWHQQMSPYSLTRGMVSAVPPECCADCLVESLQEWGGAVGQILKYSNGQDHDLWKPWWYIKDKKGLHMLDPWPWDTVFKLTQSVLPHHSTTDRQILLCLSFQPSTLGPSILLRNGSCWFTHEVFVLDATYLNASPSLVLIFLGETNQYDLFTTHWLPTATMLIPMVNFSNTPAFRNMQTTFFFLILLLQHVHHPYGTQT